MELAWTVDYGSGEKPVKIPHSWHGEMPVTWEGPAIYRCSLQVPSGKPHLVFHGVSYEAQVQVNGTLVMIHQGIWDAFAVDLSPWSGRKAEVEVRVIKNGGKTYPVRNEASGFLPYVYQTFGGLYRPVELVDGAPNLEPPAPKSKISVKGHHIYADGEPFFVKGILSWGWYPDIACPSPSLAVIRDEVSKIKEMGFNLIKICLWAPPHEYLEEMHRQGLWAWMELPLWLPNTAPHLLERMKEECLKIVRQYRRHPNILAWTAGCELSDGIDPEYRRSLVDSIRRETGHPLIKDNSGGAEMYGGNPEEFGDFDDFHPYCDAPFYPEVLASLMPGPRRVMPTLLGEFNDYDLFRPVHLWADNPPYWASSDPAKNAQGVRWQYDLPKIMEECRTTDLGQWLAERESKLMRSSISQAVWMRQRAFDFTRLDGFDGWVLTGHRHTPISSAGVVDDRGLETLPLADVRRWNESVSIILFPRRTPPWVNGGNRPGWEPVSVRFPGPALFQVAIHSDRTMECSLEWSLDGILKGGHDPVKVEALEPKEVGRFVADLKPGVYQLRLRWGGAERTFPIRVVEKSETLDQSFLVTNPKTIACPAFRECCWSWESPVWQELGWVDDWDRLVEVAGDGALDPQWLDENLPGWKPALIRLDTRTFRRLPVVAWADGRAATSLRPGGGLGTEPLDVSRNPAGQDLLRALKAIAESK